MAINEIKLKFIILENGTNSLIYCYKEMSLHKTTVTDETRTWSKIACAALCIKKKQLPAYEYRKNTDGTNCICGYFSAQNSGTNSLVCTINKVSK